MKASSRPTCYSDTQKIPTSLPERGRRSSVLVQVEALFFGGVHEPLLEHLLRGVLGQLQVVHTRVDRRVHVLRGGLLPDDGETRVEVAQSPGRQGPTPGHKLDEGLGKERRGEERRGEERRGEERRKSLNLKEKMSITASFSAQWYVINTRHSAWCNSLISRQTTNHTKDQSIPVESELRISYVISQLII